MDNCSTSFLPLYNFYLKAFGLKQHKNKAVRVVAPIAEVNEALIRSEKIRTHSYSYK